jgi:uncharacterized membrane protein
MFVSDTFQKISNQELFINAPFGGVQIVTLRTGLRESIVNLCVDTCSLSFETISVTTILRAIFVALIAGTFQLYVHEFGRLDAIFCHVV